MDTSKINEIGNTIKDSLLQNNPYANVGMSERVVSLGTGAFIAFAGITNLLSHPMIAFSEMAIGGTLLYRGITGNCPLKEMLENQNMDRQPESMTVPVTTNTTSGIGSPMTGSPVGMGGSGGTGSTGSAIL
jgi:hypothetical protein